MPATGISVSKAKLLLRLAGLPATGMLTVVKGLAIGARSVL